MKKNQKKGEWKRKEKEIRKEKEENHLRTVFLRSLIITLQINRMRGEGDVNTLLLEALVDRLAKPDGSVKTLAGCLHVEAELKVKAEVTHVEEDNARRGILKHGFILPRNVKHDSLNTIRI